MANERRGQGHNGGAQRAQQGGEAGLGDQVREAGRRIQDQAADYGESAREGFDSARESAMHSYRQAEGLVARNPSTAVLIGFGVGVGVGLLLTGLFREERPWYEGDWPRSMGRLPRRAGDWGSRLGDRASDWGDRVGDRASGWGSRLGEWGEQIGEQVSDLGRTVARNIPDAFRRS